MMLVCLTVEDIDGNKSWEYNFSMAGSNRDRVIDYACKTVRRRWANVSWFKEMHVVIGHNGDDWKWLAAISVDTNPVISIRRQ